jgi:hypothetical protein
MAELIGYGLVRAGDRVRRRPSAEQDLRSCQNESSCPRVTSDGLLIDILLEDATWGCLAIRGELAKWKHGADAQQVCVRYFKLQSLSHFHLSDQRGIGSIPGDARVGEAPDIGNLKGFTLVDGEPGAGLKIEADRGGQPFARCPIYR